MISRNNDYVPCALFHKQDTVKAKLRLKGDYSSHFETGLWSYRIKMKKQDAIMGMNRFSLHHPRERNYIYEWIFHKVMKHENVIALKYDFADVIINNGRKGLYAVEEHFEKQMLANNERREGPIIKFNEDQLWEYRKSNLVKDDQAYLASIPDLFKPNYTAKDSALKRLAEHGMNLLYAIREQRIKPSLCFNVDKVAKYYALSDLLGAHHMRHYHNLRFYVDPNSGLLEPIAFDADAGQIIGELLVHRDLRETGDYSAFTKVLFSDTSILSKYYQYLHKFSDKAYLRSLSDILGEELDQKLYVLYSNYPDFNYNQKWLEQNQKAIRTLLNPKQPLHVLRTEERKLLIANMQPIPIRINYISADNKILSRQSMILESFTGNSAPAFSTYNYTADLPEDDVLIDYQLLGSEDHGTSRISDWTYTEIHSDVFGSSKISKLKYLEINEELKTIQFKQGTHTLEKTLVLPEGYKVLGSSPLKIILGEGVSILSRSPLLFVGEVDEPIIIDGNEKSGGLAVLHAEEKSMIENVLFKNLAYVDEPSLSISGAVTFYNSEVSIKGCLFEDIFAEDALNILNTRFELANISFNSCISDAIDIDFSVGNIEDVNVRNCRNDGLDLSGSVVNINKLHIVKADDRALSVGERSVVKADKIWIESCNEGIAVKDLSHIRVQQLNVVKAKTAITAYMKKTAYGPGYAVIVELRVNDVLKSFDVRDDAYIVFGTDTIRE